MKNINRRSPDKLKTHFLLLWSTKYIMNSNPRSVILSARGNGLVLLNSYPAMTCFSFFPANFSKPDRKTDTSKEHGDLFYGYKVLPDLLPMWQNWEILWNKIIMSSAHQIADNLKITRVFISLFSWIMLPSLHNIFPDQVKKIWHIISATQLFQHTSPYCVTSRSWQVISCSNLFLLHSFTHLLHVTISSPLKESRYRRDKN